MSNHIHLIVTSRQARLPRASKPGRPPRAGGRIRRWYQNRDVGDMELVAFDNQVRALVNNRPVAARELADLTIQWMAEKVKVRRVSYSYV
jgi:hypothetical protein